MRQIFIPHGIRTTPDATPEQREALRRSYEQRTATALDQWQRAIREGFEVVGQYDTSDEGDAYVVFVMYRRQGSKTGHMTPRMRAAQAAVNLDVALANIVKASERVRVCRREAHENGTDTAFDALDEAENAVKAARLRALEMARRLLKATNEFLDQTR